MNNTKLVDSIELPLKSLGNVLTAVNKVLSSGLDIYLNQFVAPFIGDWPMQYFVRQLVYSNVPTVPAVLKNVIPLIGPLHISLNARECVLLQFHEVFADLYAFLFGKKAKLAKKPKPWRVSLLLEVIYGGWTLVRDMILSVFYKCKDIEFLTLVNLLDNYIPLVLSIYSIVFKCNKYELFYQSLIHCWVMFVVFRRRHYNKALLVTLSSKHDLNSFQSVFVPPRKFNFSTKRIDKLKNKAAKFLTNKFETLYTNPNKAVQQPRAPRQPKHTSKWKLPNLFGEKIVTNQVLLLGFMSVETQPNPAR